MTRGVRPPPSDSSAKSSTADGVLAHWYPLVKTVVERAERREEDPSIPCETFGRFELQDLLGFGGMGVVFRARDPELDRVVALKLWYLDGVDAGEALIHEAQCQARVTHANVVAIYEAGMIDDDVYLAMEFVDGCNLREWIEDDRSKPGLTLAYLVDAGKGLAAVHRAGLVHADFKPENVLIDCEHRVRVADFGIARVFDEHAGPHADDSKSSGRGTLCYMAPERLLRQGTTARSDQFSYCVTVWECVYGVPPFPGETPEELLESMARGPQTAEVEVMVPSWLRRVLLVGLSLNPARRFENMDALIREVMRAPQQVMAVRRRLVNVAGWVLTGALGVAVGLAVQWRSEPEQASMDETSGPMTSSSTAVSETEASATEASEIEAIETEAIETDATETGAGEETVPVEEITAMIDLGHFDEALDTWSVARESNWTAGPSPEAYSLVVARAFLEAAEDQDKHTPATRLTAARHAMKVASAVSIYENRTPKGEAAAENISIAAAPLVSNLRAATEDADEP